MNSFVRWFAALVVFASPLWLHGQVLPSGTYRCVAEYGDVLLDGRYPFEVTGFPPGSIEFRTLSTGALNADVLLFAEKEEATGAVRVRSNGVRLTLRGKVNEGSVRVNAVLQGSAFVGTVVFRGLSGPCRIEVGGISPVRAEYVLALTSVENGRISGTGTMTVGGEAIPVIANGQAGRGEVALTVKGGKTFLKLANGQLSASGFIAGKWTAQGFGALAKGTNLLVARAAP